MTMELMYNLTLSQSLLYTPKPFLSAIGIRHSTPFYRPDIYSLVIQCLDHSAYPLFNRFSHCPDRQPAHDERI
jgi:hypothetical protein